MLQFCLNNLWWEVLVFFVSLAALWFSIGLGLLSCIGTTTKKELFVSQAFFIVSFVAGITSFTMVLLGIFCTLIDATKR